MCGSLGCCEYNSSIREKAKKDLSWNSFWLELNKNKSLQPRDIGVFIETVKGCGNTSCQLQCQATTCENEIMPFDELHHILKLFDATWELYQPNIMLYGMGDPTDYGWKEFFDDRYKNNSLNYDGMISINVSPSIKEEDLRALKKNGVRIYFNVSTIDECLEANRITDNWFESSPGNNSMKVIVARHIDWIGIAANSIMDIYFSSYTPSDSELYVSQNEFFNELMYRGIELESDSNVYKLKSGFKPVIESCKRGKLKIRRCFQTDSEKTTIGITSNKIAHWVMNNRGSYDKLKKLALSKTDCSRCSEVYWESGLYIIKRARRYWDRRE